MEKIITYLENQMNVEERADFEQQLAADEQLRQQTELLKDTLLGVELFGDETLRNSLKSIEKNLEKKGFLRTEAIIKPLPKPMFPRIYWAAAASLAGIAILVWFFGQNPDNQDIVAPNPTINAAKDSSQTPIIPTVIAEKSFLPKAKKEDKIDLSEQEMQAKYAKYLAIAEEKYAEETSSVFTRERNSEETSEKILLDSIMLLLQQKKHQNAISVLENNVFSQKHDAKINTLKAHAYFLAKKYPKARSYFQALIKDGKSIYKEEAEYHLLLCYLTDFQHFKPDFEQLSAKILSDKEHGFYEKTLLLRGEN